MYIHLLDFLMNILLYLLSDIIIYLSIHQYIIFFKDFIFLFFLLSFMLTTKLKEDTDMYHTCCPHTSIASLVVNIPPKWFICYS